MSPTLEISIVAGIMVWLLAVGLGGIIWLAKEQKAVLLFVPPIIGLICLYALVMIGR